MATQKGRVSNLSEIYQTTNPRTCGVKAAYLAALMTKAFFAECQIRWGAFELSRLGSWLRQKNDRATGDSMRPRVRESEETSAGPTPRELNIGESIAVVVAIVALLVWWLLA